MPNIFTFSNPKTGKTLLSVAGKVITFYPPNNETVSNGFNKIFNAINEQLGGHFVHWNETEHCGLHMALNDRENSHYHMSFTKEVTPGFLNHILSNIEQGWKFYFPNESNPFEIFNVDYRGNLLRLFKYFLQGSKSESGPPIPDYFQPQCEAYYFPNALEKVREVIPDISAYDFARMRGAYETNEEIPTYLIITGIVIGISLTIALVYLLARLVFSSDNRPPEQVPNRAPLPVSASENSEKLSDDKQKMTKATSSKLPPQKNIGTLPPPPDPKGEGKKLD